MKVLVQRVLSANVTASGEMPGKIDRGLLLFVGFTDGDNALTVQQLAGKVANLRIFADQSGRLQHSVLQVKGEILAIPQFTLYADASRGRRPDFTKALRPQDASQLFDQFVEALSGFMGATVAQGKFGAYMKVSLVNDGPFTVMLAKESN